MHSPLARMVSSREPMTPAERRAVQARLFHEKRIAWLVIDEIKGEADRAVVERLCVKEYGEPAVQGRGR